MLLLSLLLSAAATADPVSDPLEAYFDVFAERRTEIHALRADLLERTVLPEETYVSEGTVTYVRPRRLIRRMEEPKSTLLIDQTRAYLYEPEIEQLQIFEMEGGPQADILFLGFDDDVRNLREAYDITLLSHEGDEHGLLLTPKFDRYRDPLFKEASIFFTQQDFLPYEIRVLQEDGSQTIYEVSNFEINPPLTPEETQIALATGTMVIEHDELRETVGPDGALLPEPLPVGAGAGQTRQPQDRRLEVRELEPLVREEAPGEANADAEAAAP